MQSHMTAYPTIVPVWENNGRDVDGFEAFRACIYASHPYYSASIFVMRSRSLRVLYSRGAKASLVVISGGSLLFWSGDAVGILLVQWTAILHHIC